MTTIKVPENLANNSEITLYLSIIEKLESELSLKEPKIPAKPVALSSLPSLINKEYNSALFDSGNIQNLLDRCSNLLIQYGKEIMP
jgi:hypothetical protein